MDSSKLKDGDHFSGEVAEDVLVNGKALIPKGSSVKGRVTNSQTAKSEGSAGLLSVVVENVAVRGANYHVSTSPVTLQAPPLKEAVPGKAASNTAVSAAQSAFVPKHGILQFFLTSPVRVKS